MDTPPTPRRALACLAIAMLMPSLDTSIANASLPALAHALGVPFAHVQWVVLAYLLAITSLIVSAGRLGDLLGRRRVLTAGIALFTLASLLCGMAPTLSALVAARALQGLGAAAMLALTVAMVSESVPRERTGRAMGLLGTMSAVGTTLGPSLGGVLTASQGWRAIFLVNVPLGLATLWLARRALPAARPPADAHRTRFDVAGTVLLATTLAAWSLAMTRGAGAGHGTLPVLLGMALAAAILFVVVETRSAAPLVRPALLRDPALSARLAMSALVATVIMTTMVAGPFYLSRTLGLPAAGVGLALSAGPLVSALTGTSAGRLVDRFGAARTAFAGLAAMAAGALLLALVPAGAGLPGYLAALGVLTVGYASFQAANNTALMSGADAAQRGVVSGLLSLSRNLGLITGASAMGAVFAAGADIATASPATVAAGMHRAYAIAAGLIVLALALGAAAARSARRRGGSAPRQLPV
jgi:EmrB/QacA subfamily drug resistance transporter